jgi:hypothetical protein
LKSGQQRPKNEKQQEQQNKPKALQNPKAEKVVNMKTIIAEKPSVAREIAGLVGASDKKDGYLTGNGYFVTWAFGHLIGLGMPEDYGISGFDKASLPIFQTLLLTVRKVKKDKGYQADTGALKQLKVIENCLIKAKALSLLPMQVVRANSFSVHL